MSDSADRVRIIGFGSLLSRSSAERSFPALQDWRLIRVPRAIRVFGHAATVFFERGIAAPSPPYEFASLCAEPSVVIDEKMRPKAEPTLGESSQFSLSDKTAAEALKAEQFMYATAFTIPLDDMKEFRRREPEFTYVSVQPFHAEALELDGSPAIMCARGSDELLRGRLGGSGPEGNAAWEHMVGRHGIDTLWDHDRSKLLPARYYLWLCVLAAAQFGEHVRENFLRTTFLADRVTSLQNHVERNPEILLTEPPESVRKFYTP